MQDQSIMIGGILASRYRVRRFLGRGGMGEVFEAWDEELAIPIALKTLFEVGVEQDALRVLKHEVLLARSVAHPNVCRVYDLGRHDTPNGTVWFLTMELLRGESLRDRLNARGRLDGDTALPLVGQMAAGLQAAHQAGVIHGDFKSGNVMLVNRSGAGGDRAVVTDFGLARPYDAVPDGGIHPSGPVAAGDHEATDPDAATVTLHHVFEGLDDRTRPARSVTVHGTIGYMAPEQLRGGTIGTAADIYALGVVLFEMMTGRLPFEATGPDHLRRRLEQDAPSPRDFVADLDERWDRAIVKCLSREPRERFQRPDALVDALSERGSLTLTDAPQRVLHNLPDERDSFVGRESDLANLERRFAGACRLLTLLGAGGMGKTRLAVRFGWKTLGDWPGGIWFCDLTEASNVTGIAAAVASSLNVPLGKGDVLQQLGQVLAGRGRCLLILDNFEQVVDHAPETVGRWLKAAPEATFFVTSRERLNQPDEEVQEVDPLTTESGMELFRDRARRRHPGFEISSRDIASVKAIVELVEGMPLAIELAAARVRVMAPGQLVERLRHRFRALAGGSEGRHATLGAMIESSWELLAPWEKAAWVQCSTFEGGFTLEAAENVLDLSVWPDAPWVVDALQSLLDKSLLRTEIPKSSDRGRHEVRFTMFVSLQEYARDKLARAGAIPNGGSGPEAMRSAFERHGRWFAQFGSDEAIDALVLQGAPEGRRFQDEVENLSVACRRASDRGDGETIASTYRAASTVLRMRGPLEAAVNLGLEALVATGNPLDRADVLAALAEIEFALGPIDAAREHGEAALDLYRAENEPKHEARVLRMLGAMLLEEGRPREANSILEDALAIQRRLGDRGPEAMTLGNLGMIQMTHGHFDEAVKFYEAALAIHRKMGNRRSEGVMLASLGVVHARQGRDDVAASELEAGLAIYRDVGDRRLEGTVIGNLGILHKQHGRPEEAYRCYETALRIHRDMGNRRAEGLVLGNLGGLRFLQGHHDEARALFESALVIDREVRNRREEAVVLVNLGGLYLEQGRLEDARRFLTEAEGILRETADRTSLIPLLCTRAEVEFRSGDRHQARARQAEAVAVAWEDGASPTAEEQVALSRLRDILDPPASDESHP